MAGFRLTHLNHSGRRRFYPEIRVETNNPFHLRSTEIESLSDGIDRTIINPTALGHNRPKRRNGAAHLAYERFDDGKRGVHVSFWVR